MKEDRYNKVFSILLCSSFLFLFYLHELQTRRRDSGWLKKLLNLIWNGPHSHNLQNISAVGGHALIASVPEHFVDDSAGWSIMTLLENGRPLNYPHTRDINDIAIHGAGRYCHISNKIVFSNSTNQYSPNKQDFKYTARLTTPFDRLSGYSFISPAASRPAGRLLEILNVLLDKRFTYKGISFDNSGNLHINNAKIDFSDIFLPSISANIVKLSCLSNELNFNMALDADGVYYSNSEHKSSVHFDYMGTNSGEIRTIDFSFSSFVFPAFSMNHKAQFSNTSKSTVTLSNLNIWHNHLMALFDTQDCFAKWLNDFLKSLPIMFSISTVVMERDFYITIRDAIIHSDPCSKLIIFINRSSTFISLEAKLVVERSEAVSA